MIFLWIVGVVWALCGTVVILIDMQGFHLGAALFHVLTSYWILALLIWRERGRKGRAQEAAAEMGFKPGSGWHHAEGGSAIAVDKEAKTVTMQVGSVKKTYPYTSIRGWEVVKQTAGEVVGGGLAGVGVQLRANSKAREATGLFVTVKDIDYPVWRIEMTQKGMQDRWMEIFRQEVNEDGAA